jgi:hypothetical protein
MKRQTRRLEACGQPKKHSRRQTHDHAERQVREELECGAGPVSFQIIISWPSLFRVIQDLTVSHRTVTMTSIEEIDCNIADLGGCISQLQENGRILRTRRNSFTFLHLIPSDILLYISYVLVCLDHPLRYTVLSSRLHPVRTGTHNGTPHLHPHGSHPEVLLPRLRPVCVHIYRIEYELRILIYNL